MLVGKDKVGLEDIESSDTWSRFIQANIPDMDAAELLLLFQGKPDVSFSVEEAIAKLSLAMSKSTATKYINAFASLGLLFSAKDRFRYNPESEYAPLVLVLQQAYSQRPVTLIRIIYALRDSKIQSFADAFRLRKD